MGLFGSKHDDRWDDVKRLYNAIMNGGLDEQRLLDAIGAFENLCASFSPSDEAAFRKAMIKESKREKSVLVSYIHPLFGYIRQDGNLIQSLLTDVGYKKKNVQKAKATRESFAAIEDVEPTINTDTVLERQTTASVPEIKIKNITKSFDIEAKMPIFTVIDLETTGLKPGKDRIIQVSAMRYEGSEPTEAMVSYVNPGKPIPKEASDINGIHDEDVKDAPTLDAIADSLKEFVGKSPVLGYNIPFDLQFLYCSGIDLISKRSIYDARVLAKKLYKDGIEYYSLENVLAYNGISIGELHDAKVDCFATGLVFLKMVDEITNG